MATGITGDIPPLLTLGGFTFPHGALIGSLDEGKTFFAIGTQMEMTVLRPAAHYDYIVGILISLTTLVLLRVDVKVYPKPKSF